MKNRKRIIDMITNSRFENLYIKREIDKNV